MSNGASLGNSPQILLVWYSCADARSCRWGKKAVNQESRFNSNSLGTRRQRRLDMLQRPRIDAGSGKATQLLSREHAALLLFPFANAHSQAHKNLQILSISRKLRLDATRADSKQEYHVGIAHLELLFNCGNLAI